MPLRRRLPPGAAAVARSGRPRRRRDAPRAHRPRPPALGAPERPRRPLRQRPPLALDRRSPIAELRPGDRARLVDATVPRWYEIRLADGTRGFVSRSWTEVETRPPPPPHRRAPHPPGQRRPGKLHLRRVPGRGRHPHPQRLRPLRPLLETHEAPPTLVVSHPHQDHYEYVPTVLAGHDPFAIWLAATKDAHDNPHNDFDTWLDRQAAAGTPIHDRLPRHWHNGGDPIDDPSLSCGDAEVFVLTVNVPRKDGTDDPNTNSLVLHLRYGDSAILPGDAEGDTETSALDNFPDLRDVTFLAAAHHGAETHHSNDPPWVSRISPRAVVYNAGWAFRHPRCVVTDRYRPHLATVTEHPMFCSPTKTSTPTTTTRAEYTTEVSGPIVVTTDGTTTTIDCPESMGCGDVIAP